MYCDWSDKDTETLKINSIFMNIHELENLFAGVYTSKQIKNKLYRDKILILKVRKRKRRQFDGYLRTQHDSNFFSIIDTPEKAYVMGFWVADGFLSNTGTEHNYQVGFSSADKEHLELVRFLLKSDHKIYSQGTSCWRLVIGSKKLFSSLVSMGFDNRKSYSAIYPDTIPLELTSHFIRGVFDGDGCISRQLRTKDKVPVVAIHFNGTLALLEEINKRLPVQCKQIRQEKDSMWRICFTAKSAKIVLSWLYQESDGLRLARKHNRYLDSLNRVNFYARPTNTTQ